MKTLASIAALILAASPAAAQFAASSPQPPSADQSGQTAASQAPATAPTTGVFCNEEMTATFCNVVRGPNTGGYGSRSSSTSSSASGSGTAGGGANTSSIPPCGAEPPFNELCD